MNEHEIHGPPELAIQERDGMTEYFVSFAQRYKHNDVLLIPLGHDEGIARRLFYWMLQGYWHSEISSGRYPR